MVMVMCRACGEFRQAYKEDTSWVPIRTDCPTCGSAEYRFLDRENERRTNDQ